MRADLAERDAVDVAVILCCCFQNRMRNMEGEQVLGRQKEQRIGSNFVGKFMYYTDRERGLTLQCKKLILSFS